MRFLERLFASRAARIGLVLVWVVFGGLGGSFAQRFQDVQKNEEASFLRRPAPDPDAETAAAQVPETATRAG